MLVDTSSSSLKPTARGDEFSWSGDERIRAGEEESSGKLPVKPNQKFKENMIISKYDYGSRKENMQINV